MPDRWLRIHMSDYDVDLKIHDDEHLEDLLFQVQGGYGVHGNHPGGQVAIIPAKSILWADVVVPTEDDEKDQA